MEMLYSLWPKKKRALLAVVVQEEIHGRGRSWALVDFHEDGAGRSGCREGMLGASARPAEGQHETSHPNSPAEWSETWGARASSCATISPCQAPILKETLLYGEPSSSPPQPSHAGTS